MSFISEFIEQSSQVWCNWKHGLIGSIRNVSTFLRCVFYTLHICSLHFSELLYCIHVCLYSLSVFLPSVLHAYILLELYYLPNLTDRKRIFSIFLEFLEFLEFLILQTFSGRTQFFKYTLKKGTFPNHLCPQNPNCFVTFVPFVVSLLPRLFILGHFIFK